MGRARTGRRIVLLMGSAFIGIALSLLVVTLSKWREIWAQRVLDLYLEAAGGREALAAIHDRVVRLVRTHVSSGISSRIHRYSKRGRKLREFWELPASADARSRAAYTLVYDGEQVWGRIGGSVRRLDDQEIDVYLRDTRLEDSFLPWEDEGFRLESSMDGQTVDVVDAIPPHGERIRYFFSASGGLLMAKEWRHREHDSWFTKRARYLKYRPIAFSDGSDYSVQFPTRVDLYMNGDWELEVLYTELRINTGFSDEVFLRPREDESDDEALQHAPHLYSRRQQRGCRAIRHRRHLQPRLSVSRW